MYSIPRKFHIRKLQTRPPHLNNVAALYTLSNAKSSWCCFTSAWHFFQHVLLIYWQWQFPVTCPSHRWSSTLAKYSSSRFSILMLFHGTSCIMQVAGKPCIGPASQAYISVFFCRMLNQRLRNRMSTLLEKHVHLKLNAKALACSLSLNLWLTAS